MLTQGAESADGSPAPAGTQNHVLAGYAPLAGGIDEYVDNAGNIRAHCRDFVTGIRDLGIERFPDRAEQVQRLIDENGISYSVYDDEAGRQRPWSLDPLPLIFPTPEWEAISRALVQRATLLNLVLNDLYGPQQLLSEGLLPPELIFRHPEFFRSLHGQRVADDAFLHTYAADIARGPDGRWWITADRTEAPSGIGYVLENRLVISRVFPDLFRDCCVNRLAPFFIDLRERLNALAPPQSNNPHIALLTEGPTTHHYFEDTYLARYLGYTLVEGGDLAIRGGGVKLKTLGGLVPVDILFRRLRTADADPLELNGYSSRGVSGLVRAAMSDRVAIANPLGAGLVESPAFLAFLSMLAKKLLGEPLLMPSVATWWCGSRKECSYVLDHLKQMVIRPAYRAPNQRPIFGEQLTMKERAELADRIKARPYEWVGQEKVQRSTAPHWVDGKFVPRSLAVRLYAVSSEKSYSVLQGGLARLAEHPNRLDTSISSGEVSKDVWVLSEDPVQPVSLLRPAGQPVRLRRTGAELPSRVADNLFWLGRQMERAEGTARLLRTLLVRLTSETDPSEIVELPTLLRLSANQGIVEASLAIDELRGLMPSLEQLLPAAVIDEQESAGLRRIVSSMLRIGMFVKDRLSIDTWRMIIQLDKDLTDFARRRNVTLSDLLGAVNRLILGFSALAGLVSESMTRTQGWRFLDIGRRLERALFVAGLANTGLAEIVDESPPIIETVVEVADSLMTYRTRYLGNFQAVPALDLLVTDETNPRSVAFQLAVLSDHVERLPRDPDHTRFDEVQRLSMTLRHQVRMLDLESLALAEDRRKLERALQKFQQQINSFALALSHRYLVHAGMRRQLSELRLGSDS